MDTPSHRDALAQNQNSPSPEDLVEGEICAREMGFSPPEGSRVQHHPKGLLYRCVCSEEFLISSDGGECPSCHRVVKAEAIRQAITATVTVGDLDAEMALHLPEHSEEDPWIGTVLGHFRLDRILGKGGMGYVYRALDTSLQRYVAVKVVRQSASDGSSTEDHVASMLTEAVAQARLNHPNVVTIYYVGKHDAHPFLAMELVSGPTLADRLTIGPLPYADVIQVGIQVADALKHAWQFGIVHADIKPSNLLISGEHQIKLSDFGLSRVAASDGVGGRVAGTPQYLAPELLEGKGLSCQSDMYALGVTLFELMFGRLPFELRGTTVHERLATHQTAVIDYPNPWPNDVPREFRNVLNRLLAKKPDDRYSDYDELLAELKRLMPVSTTSAGLAPRAMAYATDQLMLLMGFAPFLISMIALTQVKGLLAAFLIPILGIMALIVPTLYLTAIRSGWKSLGCYLFQLRIVDEHGLPLRQDHRFIREILRCMFAWLTPLATYAGLFWNGAEFLIDLAVVIFLAMDIICFFFTTQRTTLHDLIFHARVVLDFHRSPSRFQ